MASYYGPSTVSPSADFFRSGQYNEKLQTQQPILYNAQVPPDLGIWRREIIDDTSIPDDRKFGRVLSTGRAGDAFDLIHVRALEPAFYYNYQTTTQPSDTFRETRVQIFQALNGMEIDAKIRTQEQFEDGFVYAGQPMRDFHFGKPGQPATGVAMLFAGSKGCWNYGHDTWFPGDKICWRMPSIDPKKREEERATLPFDREHPALRDRCILYVQTYAHTHHFIRDAISQSFDDTRRGAHNFLRLLPGADDTLSTTERAVVAMRNTFQLHSFHTIAVLLAYGLDPSDVPGNGVDSLGYENYNARITLETKDLDQVLKLVPQINNPANDKWPEMNDGQVKAFANKLLYWAGKLGLLGNAAAEHVRPFENFISVTLGLTFRPLLTNHEMHNYFSILRFFPLVMQRGATGKARTSRQDEMCNQYDLKHPIGSLAYAQCSLMKELFASIGFAVEKQMNREIGTSLSMTAPKQWGDTTK